MDTKLQAIPTFRIERETTWTWKPIEQPVAGKALWLQQILFWILRHLKAQFAVREDTYSRTEIDSRKVIDLLVEHCKNIQSLLGDHPTPKYAVMGNRQFRECIDSARTGAPAKHPFQFHVSFPGRGGMRVFGLEVIVVPWIDGCFILPDLDQLR